MTVVYDGPQTTQQLIKLLDDAKEAMRPWAAGADPKDPFARQTWEMAGAHAALFCGLKHIVQIGHDVPSNKSVDFVGYCLQWVACVEHHHHWEEEFYFPKFAAAMTMGEVSKEHAWFKAGLQEMEEYLTSCLPQGSPWGYGKVTENEKIRDFIMDELERILWTFIPLFVKHFTDEIQYISPDKLRANDTEENMKSIIQDNDAYFKNNMPADTFLTWLVLHTPTWSGFPPVPGFVKGFVCRWVLYWKWRRWWQFAPTNPE